MAASWAGKVRDMALELAELKRLILPAWLLLSGGAVVAQAVPVKVCLPDIDAPPYFYRDAARPAVFPRLLIDGGREAGLQVVLLRLPSARCRAALASGEVDAMPLPAVPSHLAELDFPVAANGQLDAAARLGRIQFLLLRRRGETQDWDGLRLTPAAAVVGVRRGVTTLIERLQTLGIALDDQASSVEQLLAKLQARRVDLVAMSREEFLAAGPQGVEALQQPVISTDVHLAASRSAAAAVRERLAAWREQIARRRDSPGYRAEDLRPASGS